MSEREKIVQKARQAVLENVGQATPEALAEFAAVYISCEYPFDETFLGFFTDALFIYFGLPQTQTPEDLDLLAHFTGVDKVSIGNYESIEALTTEFHETENRAAAVLPFLLEAGALRAFLELWERR